MASIKAKDVLTSPKALVLLSFLLTSLGAALVPSNLSHPSTRWYSTAAPLALIIIGSAFGLFYAGETLVRSRKSILALYVVLAGIAGLGWVYYEFNPILSAIKSKLGKSHYACEDGPGNHSCSDLEAAYWENSHPHKPFTPWLICAFALPALIAVGLKFRKGWTAKQAIRAALALYGNHFWVVALIVTWEIHLARTQELILH